MFMMLIIVISKISGIDMNTSLNQVKNEVSFKTDIFYSMFVALIYAPIVEEVVFRGVVYKSIKRNYGGFKAILISSFLFGAMHVMNSFNNLSFSELIYFSIYFIMGIALGISYEYTNSIWGSIINHFIWNFITLIIMFIKIII
ncbi:CPBP family intramembrane glutamic endopeptidase [Clostridium gasigenes]|uniref:CAAX protease self-immunity n=1 Tax=Clostridium gasigenes TaxID=94869 RepID=A0A1H0T987_9CLOT|nr:CPBP family intramembrane glutamic endopeptidase [Clostridium gasigenes]SDP50584.1 CAAX protease self-immunity [Clostridium gasigenes]